MVNGSARNHAERTRGREAVRNQPKLVALSRLHVGGDPANSERALGNIDGQQEGWRIRHRAEALQQIGRGPWRPGPDAAPPAAGPGKSRGRPPPSRGRQRARSLPRRDRASAVIRRESMMISAPARSAAGRVAAAGAGRRASKAGARPAICALIFSQVSGGGSTEETRALSSPRRLSQRRTTATKAGSAAISASTCSRSKALSVPSTYSAARPSWSSSGVMTRGTPVFRAGCAAARS